jgi:hypothetical protein
MTDPCRDWTPVETRPLSRPNPCRPDRRRDGTAVETKPPGDRPASRGRNGLPAEPGPGTRAASPRAPDVHLAWPNSRPLLERHPRAGRRSDRARTQPLYRPASPQHSRRRRCGIPCSRGAPWVEPPRFRGTARMVPNRYLNDDEDLTWRTGGAWWWRVGRGGGSGSGAVGQTMPASPWSRPGSACDAPDDAGVPMVPAGKCVRRARRCRRPMVPAGKRVRRDRERAGRLPRGRPLVYLRFRLARGATPPGAQRRTSWPTDPARLARSPAAGSSR